MIYKFQNGDVVFYDETHHSRTWVGLILVGDMGKSVMWWTPDGECLMRPQSLPTMGSLYLVGNIDQDWIEWDV